MLTKDSVRHTLYAEVLLVISRLLAMGWARRYTNAIEKAERWNKLSVDEVEQIVGRLAEHRSQKPYLNDAKQMASRDYSFRDAYHGNIAEYLTAVTPEEFERFIEINRSFDSILESNKDVLQTLKTGGG